MHLKTYLLVAMVVILAIGMGCGGSGGGGGSDSGGGSSQDLSGTWRGPYYIDPRVSMTLTLQQNRGSVTGTFSSSTGATGTISGGVSGNTFTFTIDVIIPGCNGSFNGIGTINSATSISYTISGSSACAGRESGTGVLTKQ